MAEESIAILRDRDGVEMAEAAVAACSPTRSDPKESAMFGGNRWKQDDVAKDMLTSCADDAASKAAKEKDGINGE